MTAFARLLTVALIVAAPAAAASESARQNANSSSGNSGYLYFRDSGSATTLNPRGTSGLAPSLVDTKQVARSVVAPLRSSSKAKTSERTFLFTPSGKANDRKALTVGVTSRTLNIRENEADKSAVNAVDVSGYNVGLSVGYRGFSVEAGYSRVEDTRLSGNGSAEGVDVGLSYRGKDWKTTLQVAGEQYGDDKSAAPLGLDKSYSVELGGAYLLTPRLSLTGGVRYQVVSPREELRNLSNDQASGTVYVGTNLKF